MLRGVNLHLGVINAQGRKFTPWRQQYNCEQYVTLNMLQENVLPSGVLLRCNQ